MVKTMDEDKTARLNVETRKLKEVRPNPKNPRLHPHNQLNKLQDSLERFGYTKGSMVITEDGLLLAGHGMYEALREQEYGYITKLFHDAATTVATPIPEVIPDMEWVNETIFSRNSEWQELLMKQDRDKRSERKSYGDDLVVNKESATASVEKYDDDSISEYRIPTESELRQIRLMNIPTRGFCISAEEERITAESYRYLYDPEEFETPEI